MDKQHQRSYYQGEYDRILSIGMDCRPKVVMDILGLDGRRGPLDTIAVQSVKGLVKALEYNFSTVFRREYLVIQENSDSDFKRIKDTHTGYISVHDFIPTAPSIDQEYEKFKLRFNRHVNNFIHDATNYDRVLFILNFELTKSERLYTDDLDTLVKSLPVLRSLLDHFCGNQKSQLLIATFRPELLNIELPRTHIRLKNDYSESQAFMQGDDHEQWVRLFDGVSVS